MRIGALTTLSLDPDLPSNDLPDLEIGTGSFLFLIFKT